MSVGWQEKRLGDVLALEYGKPLPPEARDRGGKYAVYGANGVKSRSDKFFRDRPSIIVGRKGSAGEITLTEEKFWPLDVTYFVTFDESKYDLQFLYYLLSLQELTKLAKGVKPGINRNEVYAKAVRVPSLPEQQRIVAILDEAFAGLATATANAEKNLKNARELFESSLSGAFTKISEGHDTVRLSDIVTRLTNGYVGPTRDIYLDSGVPYLLARHVHDNHLEFDGRTFVSEEFNEKHKKSKLKKGDVLLVQSGHIGHSAVVGQDHEGHNCHAMIVISPVVGRLSSEFLSFYFGSSLMKRKFEEIRSGSTVPHLTCGLVKELMIPLPSIEAQHSLVAEFKKIEQETDRLALLATEKLFALGQLKQSVLQKAFSGELAVVPSVAKTDFADTRMASFTASVLALAYERHRLAGRERTFGHKKAQKLLHLVEAAGNVDLGRDPIKDAAGPNDFGHMLRATAWAEQQQIFRVKKSENRYVFERLPNYKRGLEEAKRETQQYSKQIDQITDFLLPMNSDEAEIIATVYAAWNNLIIKSKPVDDEAIVREAREDWHLDKMNIPRHRFFDAIELLKSKKLVPKGRAKLVREKYLI